eukprot:1158399-Pelagomonas_calceolata.AAC.3
MHAVAAHLGWRWLKLPLTSMDEVQGDLVVVLDGAGEVEQLQTLLRLCSKEQSHCSGCADGL